MVKDCVNCKYSDADCTLFVKPCIQYDKWQPIESNPVAQSCDTCKHAEDGCTYGDSCNLQSPYTSKWQPKEYDPNGLDAHEAGAKLDAGKIYASLLLDFSLALTRVAEVCTYGATKYSRGGWQHVKDGPDRYRDAAMRHLLKQRHEEIDTESGLLHEAQVIWNLMASLELKLRDKKGE